MSRNFIDQNKKCQTTDYKWDMAITIAEHEVRQLAVKMHRPRHAIKVFRANKRDGIPWPEQQKSPEGGN